ncbi:hypothetical protein E9993_14500 [Labilibacter sediminis]|nr:hypothetical protein E9993_14500 [Labilibacter sediminis]
MRTLDLSISFIVIQWANLIIDWFMNLFADPEYYWVEETYPGKTVSTKNNTNNNKVIQSPKIETKSIIDKKAEGFTRQKNSALLMPFYSTKQLSKTIKSKSLFISPKLHFSKLINLSFMV